MIEKGVLGNAIKAARIRSGLSQEELAELLGISPTHVKHIESEHRNPSIDLLFLISDTLKMSLDALQFDAIQTSKSERTLIEINYLLQFCSERELNALKTALQTLCQNKEKTEP